MTLSDFFQTHRKAALAFSGGVDSAYLLSVAKAAGCDVKPYFVKTPFQPEFELNDAKKLAPDLTVIDLDVLKWKNIEKNSKKRCYFCKKQLLKQLKKQAKADGYDEIWDGTNASDDFQDRPGMKALDELGVYSPLRLCGLTKDEIRQRSKEVGLFTWNKPAYACLATRIPAGTAINSDTLHRIEMAENALKQLGYSDFRVRVYHGAARLQLPIDQFPTSKNDYIQIRNALSPWFDTVLLDLRGR